MPEQMHRVELPVHQQAGERVFRRAFIVERIALGERLAVELPGGHLAVLVDRGARGVDGGRGLRVPASAFVTHALHAHRLADRLREHGGVHHGVAGIVAAVGAGAGHLHGLYLLDRQAEHLGDALRAVVRLLRAGPDRRLAVAHVGDAAGRRHAGMRLERPFVGGFHHPAPRWRRRRRRRRLLIGLSSCTTLALRMWS